MRCRMGRVLRSRIFYCYTVIPLKSSTSSGVARKLLERSGDKARKHHDKSFAGHLAQLCHGCQDDAASCRGPHRSRKAAGYSIESTETRLRVRRKRARRAHGPRIVMGSALDEPCLSARRGVCSRRRGDVVRSTESPDHTAATRSISSGQWPLPSLYGPTADGAVEGRHCFRGSGCWFAVRGSWSRLGFACSLVGGVTTRCVRYN